MKVSCNQTGKILTVALSALSYENGEPLRKEDIQYGKSVIYEGLDGKSYDVTINEGIGSLKDMPLTSIWIT